MSTTDKKATKVAEIVRLQELVAAATAKNDIRGLGGRPDPEYVALVDEYLNFLLHFVGTAGYEWTEARLTKMDRICEVTTNIRSADVLMKIPEDMIPPVCVREMMIGDEKGPWMHLLNSTRAQTFLAKYPFLMTRMPGA
jgi:hypothetical protein